jgi:nicotinamide N-methyltransferase
MKPHDGEEYVNAPEVKLNMVGSHPLWGHMLWNAAIVIAEYIDSGVVEVKNKR